MIYFYISFTEEQPGKMIIYEAPKIVKNQSIGDITN